MKSLIDHSSRVAAIAFAVFSIHTAYALPEEPSTQQIDRMTDAVIQAFPMEKMIAATEARNPNWPMAKAPSLAIAQKLACVRKELANGPMRQWKRDEVVAYAKLHGARFEQDITLVEIAAPAFGKLVMAGFESAASGEQVDLADLLASMTPEQKAAMVQLNKDPEMSPLRDLIGIGNAKGDDMHQGSNHEVTAVMGASGLKLLTRTMKDCDVAPGTLK